MTMKPEDFRRALEIITRNNRITVSFNTPVDNNYANTYPLLIHESNATVLKRRRLFAFDDGERIVCHEVLTSNDKNYGML